MEDVEWLQLALLERVWEEAEARLRWSLLPWSLYPSIHDATPQIPEPLKGGDLATALLQPGTALPVEASEAHRHQPWQQKEVTLEEATGFLRVHPTRVALAQHIWRECGGISIGCATEILVLHQRAAAITSPEACFPSSLLSFLACLPRLATEC